MINQPRPTGSDEGVDNEEEHHLYRAEIHDADALAVEINWFRQIYNTIRPHQALDDRTPRQAYLNPDQPCPSS